MEIFKPRLYVQVKQFVGKNIDLLIYLFLFVAVILVISPYSLDKSIIEMDELWNYQYARRILCGQIPYKDFIMLQTPFSAQLNALFLHIFEDRLIVLRWIGSLFWTINGIVTYKILRTIGKPHLIAFGYTFVISCLYLIYPHNNYNWTVVLLLSIALMFELLKIRKRKKEQIYFEIMIGLTLGFATITKQNIGLAGLAASTVFLIYHSREKSKKYFLKSVLLKYISWNVVIGGELIYLYLHTDIISAIRELIVKLSQFAGNASISYLSLFSNNLFAVLLALAVPIIIAGSLIKAIRSKDVVNKSVNIVIILYAMANLTMLIPRADIPHLLFSMPILIIAGITLFNQKNIVRQTSITTIAIILFIILLMIFLNIFKDTDKRNDIAINHYENIYLPPDIETQITKIDQLILAEQAEGKVVYFMYYQAEAYLIPLDQFSKYEYIRPGSYEEKEVLELLSFTPNIAVLIKSNDSEEGQENTAIVKYVTTNMHYDLSLEGYDLYTN